LYGGLLVVRLIQVPQLTLYYLETYLATLRALERKIFCGLPIGVFSCSRIVGVIFPRAECQRKS